LVAVCEELGERKAAAVDRRSNSNVAAADAIMLAVEERGIWTVSKASKIKGIHCGWSLNYLSHFKTSVFRHLLHPSSSQVS
jgi:hypothetical protein